MYILYFIINIIRKNIKNRFKTDNIILYYYLTAILLDTTAILFNCYAI